MRHIKLRFSNYHDVYIRKASEDISWVEIQGQNGGIIVYKPKLKRTVLRGVVLVDHSLPNSSTTCLFTDRTHGFEHNAYIAKHYRW